jgi:hypothetical protein
VTSHFESVALRRYVEESFDQEDARATTIALYQEGALEDDDAESVRSHLDVCEECREVAGTVSEVVSLLGDTPVPPLNDETLEIIESSAPPLDDTQPSPPTDLADRIDAVLRRERSRHESAEREADQDADQILTLTPGSRSRRWVPYLVAAAAAVFLFGGGFAAVTAWVSKDEPAAAPPPSADEAPMEADEEPEAALPIHPQIVESSTAYTETDFAADAATLARWAEEASVAGEAPAEDGAEEDRPAPSPSVPEEFFACVHELGAESGDYPVLADLAEYEGEPVWVLVYEADTDTAEEDSDYLVQAVSRTCGEPDSGDPEILDSAPVTVD